MKIKAFGSIVALLVLSLTAASSASAQTASGTYQFSFEDGQTKYLEFEARALSGGGATGQLMLSDEDALYYYDLDGSGAPEERYPGFYIRADIDGLVVNRNQAVMSATVRESNVPQLVGQRVLLTVEDNGENGAKPDQLTWGVYQPVRRDWTPSDAELKDDPGVGLTWTATDAERRDDPGIQMPRDESITVQSFPVSAYAFATIARGAGDIRVQP